jgi:predicted nucleotidyltransferase
MVRVDVAVPDEESWLDTAVSRLRSAFDPESIVQFGSRARGTSSRKSDLDLLIVAESVQTPLERIGAALKLLSDSPWPLDIVVLTPQELALRDHSPFIRTILREGKVLYERRAA